MHLSFLFLPEQFCSRVAYVSYQNLSVNIRHDVVMSFCEHSTSANFRGFSAKYAGDTREKDTVIHIFDANSLKLSKDGIVIP